MPHTLSLLPGLRIFALPSDCTSGLGFSCPLETFLDYVRMRVEDVGNFEERCELHRRTEGGINFLSQ